MDDSYATWCLIWAIAGFVLEFVYRGYLSALESLSEASLEREAEEEESREAMEKLKLLKQFGHYRITGLIWEMVIFTGLGVQALRLFTSMPKESLPGTYVLIAAFVGILAAGALIFVGGARLVPEWLAERKPEAWVKLNGLIRLLSIPIWPFAKLTDLIATLIVGIFGVDPEADEVVTEDEIVSMVNEGHEQGILQASEAEMINNIFEFGDKEAGDIMTHRKNISAIPDDMTLREAVAFLIEEGNSRVPVYHENLDDIIGFLNLKDAVRTAADETLEEMPVAQIAGLLREIRFIPATRKISTLFKTMQSEKIHIVMVVDEYGQIDGLITMEDILEEIVGNILDEYDDEEKFVTHLENGYRFSGMTPLEEVEEVLGLNLEDAEYDTLNGLLISLLDRIPKEHEKPELDYEGYHFSVEKVENKMIKTVRVTALPKPVEEENA